MLNPYKTVKTFIQLSKANPKILSQMTLQWVIYMVAGGLGLYIADVFIIGDASHPQIRVLTLKLMLVILSITALYVSIWGAVSFEKNKQD